VREKVEGKVLGMSYLTIGMIVLGAGVVGTAYYLGRSSAPGPRPEGEAGREPEPRASRAARTASKHAKMVIQPVIGQALRSAVTAVTDRLKYQPTCDARL